MELLQKKIEMTLPKPCLTIRRTLIGGDDYMITDDDYMVADVDYMIAVGD